jgi:hypothetical protein
MIIIGDVDHVIRKPRPVSERPFDVRALLEAARRRDPSITNPARTVPAS